MKNVIMNAFAISPEKCGGANIQSNNSVTVYLKNIYVSLKSAKLKNPGDDVVLVSNFDIPEPFQSQLIRTGVQLKRCEFNQFVVPSEFTWSLAFYKLCALKYIIESKEYEKILLLDTDTVCVGSLSEVWNEAEKSLLLYNVHSQFNDDVRRNINMDFIKLYSETGNLQHYGGEFVCGKRLLLEEFIRDCKDVYRRIQINDFDIDSLSGDELIVSIAARGIKNLAEANPYISRYWTGLEYIVDTKCHSENLVIWHFPGEKELGMLRTYQFLVKHDYLPNRLYKYFGLPKKYRSDILLYIIKKVIMNKGKRKS